MNTKADTALEKFWNSEKGIKYFIIVIIGMVIVSILLTITLIFRNPSTQPPPVSYSQSIYYPDKEMYCPGDTAKADIQVHIEHAPAIIQIINTIWSIDQKKTIVLEESPQWAIQSNTETINRTILINIPNGLPGKYEYRQASSIEFSEPAFFVVPFTISETCP